jgi:hypothetical protein
MDVYPGLINALKSDRQLCYYLEKLLIKRRNMRFKGILSTVAFCVFTLLVLAPGRAHSGGLTVMAVGDILPHPSWIPFEVPVSKLTESATPTFFGADIVMGNLETPLTDKTEPTPVKSLVSIEAKRNFVFKSESPDTAQALREAGINVLTLANNHILDYREEGLVDTLGRLDKAGIAYAGAGLDAKKAETPAIKEIRGLKFVILAASDVVPEEFSATKDKPGILSMKNAGNFMKLIRQARKDHPDGIIVLSLHWGVEATLTPSERQKTLARKFIDAGADLIVGHHPHRIQGVEYYKGRPIFYSLGNFLFDTNPPGDETFIASILYDTESKSRVPKAVTVLPVHIQKGGSPKVLAVDDAMYGKILGLVHELCEPLGTGLTENILIPPTDGKPGKHDYWGT